MSVVIKVDNLSKQYRLGKIGTGSLSHDINRWWHVVRGREDPYRKIGAGSGQVVDELVWALRDVSFEVKAGEVLGVIGKNGAGKSTLLKILSRTTAPTTGTVKVKGRIASLLEVGTGFHPELTGRENVFLNGAILGMSKQEIRSKFDEIVDFSGVEKYIDTPVKRYSSGMYVRLAFAVAAHLEPEILIVDEVLAVGDAEFQKKAIGKMKDVSKDHGRTVLFVSHNMAAVRALCTKGILLKNGSIDALSSIEDLIDRYLLGDVGSNRPLSDRSDRIGNGRFRFTNIRFENENSESISSVFTGQMLRIVVEYETSIKDFNINLLTITMELCSEMGQQLSFFVTDEMEKRVIRNGKQEIELKINRLLLRGGVYSVKLFSSYGSTTPADFCDIIENAAEFRVISSDFWKKNVIIRSLKAATMEAEYIVHS